MEIYGFKRNYVNTFLTWVAILASGFLLRLVFYWKPHWMLYFTHSRCLLEEAEKVLLIDKYNQYFVEKVEHLFGVPHPSTLIHKGDFHKFDEDEILTCKDDQIRTRTQLTATASTATANTTSPAPPATNTNSRPKKSYGSLVSRTEHNSFTGSSRNEQTLSVQSTKSTSSALSDSSASSSSGSESEPESEGPVSSSVTRATNGRDKAEERPISEPRNDESFVIQFLDSSNIIHAGDTNNNSKGKYSSNCSDRYDCIDEGQDPGGVVKFFENKKIRYIWDDEEKNFVRLRGLDKNVTFDKLKLLMNGLNKFEQRQRRLLFGENKIHVVVQPYLRILFEEVLGPFYIFQLFSIIIWFNDNYYYYGTCIIIMSILSLVSGVLQIRKNQQQLHDTVESIDYVKVCRRGSSSSTGGAARKKKSKQDFVNNSEAHDNQSESYEEIESSKLVPGDVVVVPTFDCILQFDAVLLNGNVIVNESMLTGESVPVTKTPLPIQAHQTRGGGNGGAAAGKPQLEMYYDEKEHAKHTLFCGTKVLQTRYYGGVYVKALVIRVGFQTAKGELIRSIMFPKPVDFRFNKQIHKFIGVLACLATIGFLYSVVLKSHRGADLKSILISAFDLITIVIPPALPAAMTIGIIYAQSRLRANKIFCISPRSINISGCINCVCFDKTGTLTEDNLSFNEIVPLIEEKCVFGRPFDEEVMQTDSKKVERDHNLLLKNGDYSPLMICLASCHSLTIIDQKIIGDPLDLQMFEATGWVLEEPDVNDENKFDLLAPTVVRPPKRKRRTPIEAENYAASGEFPSSGSSTEDELDVVSVNTNRRCQRDVGILRQFPFSSNLQRMSVITRQFSGNQYVVYCKGAPEKIASLCLAETLPDDFSEVLHGYTRKGFRVLALAYRPLKVGLSYTRMQRATRQDIEKDLRFLGLLTLGNLLKPETLAVIETLNKAAIRSIMVTGDNMLTAISVANECGMILENDKTILLQVEKPMQRSGSDKLASPTNKKTSSDQAVDSRRLERQPEKQQPVEGPATLDVDTIMFQQQSRTNESDPILSRKSHKEPPARPKLTWHYVYNEQPEVSSGSNSNNFLSSLAIGDSEATAAATSESLAQKSNKSGSLAQTKIQFNDTARTHLAMVGDTWDVILRHYPELINPCCIRGTVFARMSPHQKQQLVEQLQSLQYYVGMCGDGANDSGALRSAHAGISLSDTEASVAAPFTSANANISCVPILIGEGRAALVTAFGILKYMALYSMTQFCSVLLLYTMYTNFTDTQFLYEDLFIIAILVALFGRTEPYSRLDSKAPSSSLLSVAQLSSVSLQLLLVVFFQALSLVLIWQNDWYIQHESVYDHDLNSHDNFAIFSMSSFQCISLAIIFSKGKPYRKSILSNYLLTGAFILITCLTIIIILIPAEWNIPYISLEVLQVPIEFRAIMILLALIHFFVAMFAEKVIVDHLIFRKSEKFLELFGIDPKVPLFEAIDRKTRSTTRWLSMVAREASNT